MEHGQIGSDSGSSARSFPQRGNSLRILLRSSLLSVEKPCPLSRPRTSSPKSFALVMRMCPRRCGGLSFRTPTFFRNVYNFLAPHNSIGGLGEVNEIQSKSWGGFGITNPPCAGFLIVRAGIYFGSREGCVFSWAVIW